MKNSDLLSDHIAREPRKRLFRCAALAVCVTALVLPTTLLGQTQQPLPIAPPPPDMPAPNPNAPFSVTVVSYQALPPNNNYSFRFVAPGGGKAVGNIEGGGGSLPSLYNPATQTLLPLSALQVPGPVYGFDGVNMTGVANVVNLGSRCYLTTPTGTTIDQTAADITPTPFLNVFFTGYTSGCLAVDNGIAVGTQSNAIWTSTPLNGGDGTSFSTLTGSSQTAFAGSTHFGPFGPLTGCCSRARAITGNQVVGDVSSNTGAPAQLAANPFDPSPAANPNSAAVVWDLTNPSTSVQLGGVPSMASATNGLQQGGWSGGHAVTWSGSAASMVDLNPAGYFDSRVSGMSSAFQAGDGWLGGPANTAGAVRHALLWKGSASSVVDLNQYLPPSISGAAIDGTDLDGNIIGRLFYTTATTNQELGLYFAANPAMSISSFTLSPSNPAPGDTVTGTVTLKAPAAPGGVTVNITSNNSGLVQVLPFVLIPEGQTSASFNVATTAAYFLAAPGAVTLTATGTLNARVAGLNVTPTTPADALVSLTLPVSTVAPGDTVVIQANLSGPAPAAGVLVNFASSTPGVVPAPASLLIPAGQSSGTVSVVTNSAAQFYPVSVVLQGQTGNVVRQASLTVVSVSKPNSVVFGNVQNGLTSVQGATSGTGTVYLSAVTTAPGVITLTNANPALTVPTSVSIPAGAFAAGFTYQALPVSTVTSGTLSATFNGATASMTASVTPSPSPTVQSISILPVGGVQYFSGQTLTATVTLSGQAFLGGMTVPLSTDTPTAVQIPASVAVPSLATSVTFTVTTLPVTVSTPVTITATPPGEPAFSVTLTVTPVTIKSFVIPLVSSTQTWSSGQTLTGTITLNGPAFSGGMTVALSTDSPTAVQLPASVAIPPLATSASFQVTALAVTAPTNVIITAALPGFAAVPVSLSVIPGPALTLTYTFSPYTMIGPGVVTTGTITLNQPAPTGGVGISLSTSGSAAKVPSSVTVPQGQTSASFTAQGNSVSAATTVTMFANYKGPLAPLGAGASTSIIVEPTDTLHVTQATWSKATQTLTVTATSTNAEAIITVLNANGNVPLGAMTNQGNSTYGFQITIASISSINIKSNFGGSTGQGVSVTN